MRLTNETEKTPLQRYEAHRRGCVLPVADCVTCTLGEELERLRASTGCARDQGLTQFCAEAAQAKAEVARLRVQLANPDALCQVCFTSAFEPCEPSEKWPDGFACLTCEQREWLRVKDAELERLRADIARYLLLLDAQRACECSSDDVCEIVAERNAAEKEIERLRAQLKPEDYLTD